MKYCFQHNKNFIGDKLTIRPNKHKKAGSDIIKIHISECKEKDTIQVPEVGLTNFASGIFSSKTLVPK